MSRWFRFYDAALDDPKVQALPGDLFKTWVNLLCIASKNGGSLPVSDLPFLLRLDEKRVAASLKELSDRGLIDATENGAEPHNWSARQFKSDVSNERVKRHRNGKRNVTSNDEETPPDTEADTEQIKAPAKPTPRTELEAILDPVHAQAIIDHRQRKRAPLTAHAAGLLAKKLAMFVDPNAAADKMIEKGWQTIEPGWDGVPPLKPMASKHAENAAVWVREEDPKFPILSERHEREYGRKASPMGSRNETGVGRYFPKAWLDEAA